MNNGFRWAMAAVIIAAGMVVSAALLSKVFLKIRHERAIEVKGYAEKDVASDVGKFFCRFSARGTNLKEAYAALQKCRETVAGYLQKQGFQGSEIVLGTIETTKVPKRDAQGKEMNEIEFYDLAQSASIMSTNVTAIRDVATAINDLIREGINIVVSSPEFYVTSLKDTKLELLALATEDGYRRAETLAAKSGGKVGSLISAEQGVFQITKRNSTDTSGYGMYDTETIEKTVKAIVALAYAIEADKRLNTLGPR